MIRILTILLLLWSFPGLAFSDNHQAVTQRYTLMHQPLAEAATKIGVLLSDDGTVSMQPGRNIIEVHDSAAVQVQVKKFLNVYDRPPKSVAVTVSLMLASDQRRDQAGRHTPLSALSAEVRGVMESVGDFTRWIDYEPLGEHDETSTEGRIVSARLDDSYGVQYRVDLVETLPSGTRVRLSPFRLIRYRKDGSGGEATETVFETSMSLPDGRMQVLGAASGADAERALFLTVRVQAVN